MALSISWSSVANQRPESSAWTPETTEYWHSHSNLVNSVQDTKNWRKEIQLQSLSIFKEPQRIPSKVTDLSAEGKDTKYEKSLGGIVNIDM